MKKGRWKSGTKVLAVAYSFFYFPVTAPTQMGVVVGA
jgi:hypothetical protein